MCLNAHPNLTATLFMSCCGFPPPSNEPRYPIHPDILQMLEEWESMCPTVGIILAEELSSGDWRPLENEDDLTGLEIPPFTPTGAVDFAVDELKWMLLEIQTAKFMKEGPWHVRWGLTKPKQTLEGAFKRHLDTMTAQARAVREKVAQSNWVGPSTLAEQFPQPQPQAAEASCCSR